MRRRDAILIAFSSVRCIDTLTQTYSHSLGIIIAGSAIVVKLDDVPVRDESAGSSKNACSVLTGNLATHDPRDPIVDETSRPVDFGVNRQFSDIVCRRDDLFC